METRVVAQRPGDRCPYCRGDVLDQPDVVVTCPECSTVQHRACVSELQRCATMGCAGLGPVAPPRRARVEDRRATATPPPAAPEAARPARQGPRRAAFIALAVLALGWIPTLIYALRERPAPVHMVNAAQATVQGAWKIAATFFRRGEFARAAEVLRIAQPSFPSAPERMRRECEAMLITSERLAEEWPAWLAERDAIRALAPGAERTRRATELDDKVQPFVLDREGRHNPAADALHRELVGLGAPGRQWGYTPYMSRTRR